jgi:YVTN family beta-propeller protein
VHRSNRQRGLNEVIAHPDGRRVFVGVGDDGKIQVLDVQSNRLIATAEAGEGTTEMALTPDGRKLDVLRAGANSVAVIDASAYRRTADIPAGTRPSSLVISQRPSLPREGG